MENKIKLNLLWFLGALISPYLTLYIVNFLLSLIWDYTRNIPKAGVLLPLDMFPYWLAIGALIYCFSKIQFRNWIFKLLVITVILANIIIIGPYVALVTACAVWHNCL